VNEQTSAARGAGFVVIGDLMVDIMCRVEANPAIGTDTPARIATHAGGGGANVAAWIADRGPAVNFIGRAGNDRWGQMSVDQLIEVGVTCHIVRDQHEPTGTCVVLVTPDGERTMMPDAGANAHLAPSDVPDSLFRKGSHLHLSGYTLFRNGSRLAGLAALDLARRRAMTISVDVSSTAPLKGVGTQAFLEWTSGADLCFANADEAELLSGMNTPESAAQMLAQHFGTAVVKQGPAGAIAFGTRGEATTTPSVTVDVVDTTGAGDAFAAGFLIPWTQGRPLNDCLARATVLAGRAVAGVGGRP
jgi:sugar/nucleoside kinase (ribokinase family)